MHTKSAYLLLATAPFARAESFTLAAYAPRAPVIHGKPINASGQRFVIGLDAPSAYCPDLPRISCPAGTSTTVDEDLTHLQVAAPGGQAIYVAPDGVVSYTRAHSSYVPAGAMLKGFYGRAVASTCSTGVTRLLDFLSTDGANLQGVYACPNPDLENTWLLVAAGRRSRALRGDCVLLEGLELQESEVEVGAWEY